MAQQCPCRWELDTSSILRIANSATGEIWTHNYVRYWHMVCVLLTGQWSRGGVRGVAVRLAKLVRLECLGVRVIVPKYSDQPSQNCRRSVRSKQSAKIPKQEICPNLSYVWACETTHNSCVCTTQHIGLRKICFLAAKGFLGNNWRELNGESFKEGASVQHDNMHVSDTVFW